MATEDSTSEGADFTATNVVYTYRGGRRALWDVSFSWPRSGVVALMGPNGSGKSTLLSLVVGLREPSAGILSIAPGTVGFVPQAATWPGRFTVEELLTYAAWWQRIPRSKRAGHIREAAHALDLEKALGQRISSLSGGYLRRAMIAQAVVHGPQILVLDEPSSGLDPRQRVRLRETVANLARDRLVIVATHLVEDVDHIADHVTILDEGEVVVDQPIVSTTTAGAAATLEKLYLATVAE